MHSKPNRIMQVFELENDFLKHREKIVKVQHKNMVKQLKRTHNSQMQIINTFKKNWIKANTFKTNEKIKQINHENVLLHKTLTRQYNRSKSLTKPDFNPEKSVSSRSNSISSRVSVRHSFSKENKLRKQQNVRLLSRIVAIESTLSKNKMKKEYNKTKETKKRLQVFSSRNKQKMRMSLKKMKVQPTVSFPRVKSKFQTIK